MRRALIAIVLIGFAASPAFAQGKGKGKNKVPPGHMPRAGECRVWYDGVPPGQQPAPTNCDNAERIASRDRNARVIYGDDRRGAGGNRDDRWYPAYPGDDRVGRNDRIGRDDGRRRGGQATGRAVPRDDARYPSAGRGYESVAFRQGYQDGIEKAREDTRDGDKYDPARHGWYKSANRGYDSRYGSKEQYADAYRDGFLDGYRETYRGNGTSRGGWWPF